MNEPRLSKLLDEIETDLRMVVECKPEDRPFLLAILRLHLVEAREIESEKVAS